MAILKMVKEKVVAEDMELGMGEVIQKRGTGHKLNAGTLPFSLTSTTEEEIMLRETIARNNEKLQGKMDKSGGRFSGAVHGQYPTSSTEFATVQFVLNSSSGGVITWKGVWTPTAAEEYPADPSISWGYFVQLDADYTFVGGDLQGKTVHNREQLVYTDSGWVILSMGMNDTYYYKLDGTNNLLANLQMGGYRVVNMQDGVNPNDGATVRQLLAFAKDLGDLADVNDSAKEDGDTLLWSDDLQLWVAGEGVPKTDSPALEETTAALIQNEEYNIKLLNYSSTATYTVTSTDEDIATGEIVGASLVITSADLTADATATISVVALEPELSDSVPATVAVSVTYVPFVTNTIINNDFQGNAYYVDGFDFA